jgi:hypothetical protein
MLRSLQLFLQRIRNILKVMYDPDPKLRGQAGSGSNANSFGFTTLCIVYQYLQIAVSWFTLIQRHYIYVF